MRNRQRCDGSSPAFADFCSFILINCENSYFLSSSPASPTPDLYIQFPTFTSLTSHLYSPTPHLYISDSQSLHPQHPTFTSRLPTFIICPNSSPLLPIFPPPLFPTGKCWMQRQWRCAVPPDNSFVQSCSWYITLRGIFPGSPQGGLWFVSTCSLSSWYIYPNRQLYGVFHLTLMHCRFTFPGTASWKMLKVKVAFERINTFLSCNYQSCHCSSNSRRREMVGKKKICTLYIQDFSSYVVFLSPPDALPGQLAVPPRWLGLGGQENVDWIAVHRAHGPQLLKRRKTQ